jgi:hypothetical protein
MSFLVFKPRFTLNILVFIYKLTAIPPVTEALTHTRIYKSMHVFYTQSTKFSVMTLDGRTFYFTSADTIRHLLEVLLKEAGTNGIKERRKAGKK